MRLLDRINDRRRAQGYYEGMASGAATMFTFPGSPDRELAAPNLIVAAQQAYATNGIVFAVILARMLMLSEAVFKLRSKVDKHMYGTEDLRVLEYPWPDGTTGELIARMEQDASQAGNAFVAVVEDGANPQLLRLPPDEVAIVSKVAVSGTGVRYRQLLGYDWDPQRAAGPGIKSQDAQFFTPEEVAHWSPIPDPAANFRGMSWLSPIYKEIFADSGMTGYKNQYLDHGTPVTAIKYAAKLRPDTIDSVVERLRAKYGGASNAWNPLVIDQGADPMMGPSLGDLDYRNVQAGGETRICSAGGVPPIIVGLRDAEPGSNYKDAVRKFADVTCRPLWRSLCASLEHLVPNMPPRGVQLWYDTTDIAALQQAETEKAQVTQVSAAASLTLIQAGFTRESVVKCVQSGDWGQLVPDPNAPTPGVVERETITGGSPFDTAGDPTDPKLAGAVQPALSGPARPAVTGNPPGGGQTLTKPQTPASKAPMPSSFPTSKATANGKK
jgi:phage portal protein BeeE